MYVINLFYNYKEPRDNYLDGTLSQKYIIIVIYLKTVVTLTL